MIKLKYLSVKFPGEYARTYTINGTDKIKNIFLEENDDGAIALIVYYDSEKLTHLNLRHAWEIVFTLEDKDENDEMFNILNGK